jgi:glycosyltransferase involved in cell wall biosynthesis
MEKRLLIITQKIDKDDPILGFFHGWVAELAASVPLITVVCLELGTYELPSNVKVLSLGKETGAKSRWKYATKFYSYIWSERNNYDIVFVHMNQEYVLIGGIFWRLLRKRIAMWRIHPRGNFFTRVAGLLSNRVYCITSHSYVAKFKNTKLMPHGINTNSFRPQSDVRCIQNSMLFAARISPIKRLDLLLKAADTLWTNGVNFKLSIVGDSPDGSEGYYADLRKAAALLEMEGIAAFYEGVPQEHMPELYSSHELFVNLTETGSFDKTVLEAMACGCLPVVSNVSFRFLLPSECRDMLFFKEGDADDLAQKLEAALALPQEKKEAIGKVLREIVVEKHSLHKLIRDLTDDFQNLQ